MRERRLTFARARLAAALVLSALFHLAFLTGITVDVARHGISLSPATFTARLEAPAPRPRARAPGQSAPEGAMRGSPGPLPGGHGLGEKNARPPAATSAASLAHSSAGSEDRSTLAPAASPIAETDYYAARELDSYPVLAQPIAHRYPERALAGNVSGRVRALLLIDEAGMVNEVSIIGGQPPEFFENATRAALENARFFPARKDGRTVKSRLLVDVDFAPAATEGAMP